MKIMSSVFLMVVACSSLLHGNDVIQRLKELSVESACFDLPCLFYFDIELIDELYTPGEEGIRRDRYLGRQIVRPGQIRMDYVCMTEHGNGERRIHEHLLSLGPKERFVKLGLFGGSLQDVKSDPTDPATFRMTLPKVNPFYYTVAGSFEVYRRDGSSPIENIIKTYSDIEGEEFLAKNVGEFARYLRSFKFDDEQWFKLLHSRVHTPPNEKTLWKELSSAKDMLAKWPLMLETRVSWTDIESIGSLPEYSYSFCQAFKSNSSKDSRTMEAYFFGYQFDNLNIDKYFDKSRWNDLSIAQDFALVEIEKLSQQARQKEKSKSTKK
jgi:hypothetical protein